MTKIGELYCYTGPMFCGKSSELYRLIDRESYAQKANPKRRFLVFNSIKDVRFGKDHICTHDGKTHPAHFLETSKQILEIYKQHTGVNTVFIDEAMFFDSGLVNVVKEIMANGSNTHLSFLDMTSEGQPFPFSDGKDHVGTLLAMAYKVDKLRSICAKTGEEATMTHHMHGKKSTAIEVGADDKYIPVSAKTWHSLNHE